jgi:hypothetical protein
MREIRKSGSEGGGNETNRFSLPLLLCLKLRSSPFSSFLRCESSPVLRHLRGLTCTSIT